MTSEVLFYCLGGFFSSALTGWDYREAEIESIDDQENLHDVTWAKFSFAISFA